MLAGGREAAECMCPAGLLSVTFMGGGEGGGASSLIAPVWHVCFMLIVLLYPTKQLLLVHATLCACHHLLVVS